MGSFSEFRFHAMRCSTTAPSNPVHAIATPGTLRRRADPGTKCRPADVRVRSHAGMSVIARGIISGVYLEAVRVGVGPPNIGLTYDAGRALTCEECDAQYHLYYDSDAEGSLTDWRLLAQEIITARHPHHTDYIALNRVERF
jgi:hypothetical protein